MLGQFTLEELRESIQDAYELIVDGHADLISCIYPCSSVAKAFLLQLAAHSG